MTNGERRKPEFHPWRRIITVGFLSAGAVYLVHEGERINSEEAVALGLVLVLLATGLTWLSHVENPMHWGEARSKQKIGDKGDNGGDERGNG